MDRFILLVKIVTDPGLVKINYLLLLQLTIIIIMFKCRVQLVQTLYNIIFFKPVQK